MQIGETIALSVTNSCYICYKNRAMSIETIVTHRYIYSRVSGVDYNQHNPKTLNPKPPKEIMADWEADYAKMKEDMIYEENKPSFEALINNISDLIIKLQSVSWQFELSFPAPFHKKTKA